MKRLHESDIHLLRVFVRVVQSGGLSAAQEQLGVALSTISTQISTLEVRVGFRICNRGRSGFSLTPKGGELYNASVRLFGELENFRQEVDEISESEPGTIRIGLLDSLVTNPDFGLSSVVDTCKRENRKLHFEIVFYTPGEIEPALLKKQVDVAIGWTGYRFSSLDYEALFAEHQLVYCEKRHPLFERANEAELVELESMDWVSRKYELPTDLPFSRPPLSTASAGDMEAVAYLILSGSYLGYLPEHYAASWVGEGRLRPVLPQVLGYDIEFCMITSKAEKPSPALARFAEIMLGAG